MRIGWFWPALFAVRVMAFDPECAFERALQLHQSGQFEEAVREYRNCLNSEPGRTEIRSNLGAVLSRLGRYQEAIAEYKEALRSAPAEIALQLRFNLGLAYYKTFAIPEAVEVFDSLQAGQPGNLNLALLRADCRLRLEQFPQAIEILEPYEREHAQDPALDYVLGMALIRGGRVDEGQQRVDRILGRGESAEAHFSWDRQL